MTVIDLNQWKKEQEPHAEGTAMCIQCKHEWEAVVPLGEVWFECPSCGCHKGCWKYTFSNDPFWQCNCGNELFILTPDGAKCVLCGNISEDWL